MCVFIWHYLAVSLVVLITENCLHMLWLKYSFSAIENRSWFWVSTYKIVREWVQEVNQNARKEARQDIQKPKTCLFFQTHRTRGECTHAGTWHNNNLTKDQGRNHKYAKGPNYTLLKPTRTNEQTENLTRTINETRVYIITQAGHKETPGEGENMNSIGALLWAWHKRNDSSLQQKKDWT